MEFDLPFYVVNGDGVPHVEFHQTVAAARQADDEQLDNGEGWGDGTAGQVRLKIEVGKLYFRVYEVIDGMYQFVWKEVFQP